MSSNFLNRDDWTKQVISKILTITHSQWIYRSTSLHSALNGYLYMKNAKEVFKEIKQQMHISPEEISAESRFLLEIGIRDLTKTYIKIQA